MLNFKKDRFLVLLVKTTCKNFGTNLFRDNVPNPNVHSQNSGPFLQLLNQKSQVKKTLIAEPVPDRWLN